MYYDDILGFIFFILWDIILYILNKFLTHQYEE